MDLSSCSTRRSPTRASPPSAPARCGSGRRAGASGYEQMTDLPGGAARAAGASRCRSRASSCASERSASDGTVKALFATADGRPLEAVLMRYPRRRAARSASPRSRAAR